MHVTDPNAVLAEIVRVLRPGGIVVLLEPDWHSIEISHADRTACRALQTGFANAIKNPSIGADLAGLAAAFNLAITAQKAHQWRSTVLAEIDQVLQLDRMADVVVRQGLYPGSTDDLTLSLRAGAIAASLTLTCLAAVKQPPEGGGVETILTGRWTLVHYEVAVGERPFLPVLGEGATGELLIGDDGRLSVVIVPDPTMPNVPDALAYTGCYNVSGCDLAIRIELATILAWRGTVQHRRFALSGNLLTMDSQQAKSSISPNECSRGRAIWRRAVATPE
jgi:hypothetical protein